MYVCMYVGLRIFVYYQKHGMSERIHLQKE